MCAGGKTVDQPIDKDLKELVATGKAQGYLTYDQVNEYLPDEAVNPEKLDNLLVALEEVGIELVSEAPKDDFDSNPARRNGKARTPKEAEDDEPLPTAEQ